MQRRHFLTATATLGVAKLFENAVLCQPPRARELRADVLVLGGGLGGCAAALAAARQGATVIMTEETDWIGGQLTQQAVPPDEHPWIEMFGCTRSYRLLRNGIRDYYRRHYPLVAEARERVQLNPGNGNVSRLCHEPRVALAVLEALLAPYVSSGRVSLLLHTRPVAAEFMGDRVASVTVANSLSNTRTTLIAPFFLDATEHGDLLPLTRTEYVTGFESQKETGEPHAPAEAQPQNIQSFTCCFAMDHLDGENHVISKPDEYDFWRDYVPQLRPAWPGKLLSWDMTDPQSLKRRPVRFDPIDDKTSGPMNLWRYRRIADRKNFVEGTWLGNLYEVPEAEAARHLQRAKNLSLSLLYWMQTEAPRADGKQGWPGLRLRSDLVGTEVSRRRLPRQLAAERLLDGLAKYPYVRESRRIKPVFTVLEQHVGTDARMKLTGKKREELTAERFPDSVGIGSYRIDLHPSSGGDNYVDVSSLPFQIPLGALLPQRMENLLPACKNLGVTHITNGCYRLHPVEWNIGEAAGMLATFCLRHKEPPRRVHSHKPLLADFQRFLQIDGFELEWPKLSPR